MPDPQLIQIKKYPNRRLYDQTRSRHLTHDDLFELVVAGHTVAVTDSKTGEDITNLVLAQALIEHSPEKFAAFPPELLHLMIRASETMLRAFATSWFTQLMKSMAPMGMGSPGGASTTSPIPPTASSAGASTTTPWPMPPGFGWPGAPVTSPNPAAATPSDPVADLHARMDAMMRELVNLQKGAGSAGRGSGKP